MKKLYLRIILNVLFILPLGIPAIASSETLSIVALPPLAGIVVAYDTALGAVGLPTTVVANLSDSTNPTLPVVWDSGVPVYNSQLGGFYSFTGSLVLPAEITNPNNLTASIIVQVPFPIILTPIIKDECHNDGWRTFNRPILKNQGQCVSYIKSNIHADKRD